MEIPRDLECKDCTVRLVRQALEWGKRYLFWSCGDVDIIPAREYAEDCSGKAGLFVVCRIFPDVKFIYCEKATRIVVT